MAANKIGKISEFNEEQESFLSYMKRLKLYFNINEVKEEKQGAIFCLLMGAKTFQILTNLIMPEEPETKPFSVLEATLKNYFAPKRLKAFERYQFYKRNQKETELVAEYAMELKRLAMTCEFGAFLEEALKDKLVSGLSKESVQQRILSKQEEVNFQETLKIAMCMELAEVKVEEMQPKKVEEVNYQTWKEKKTQYDGKKSEKVGDCNCCGKKHKGECKYRKYVCRGCNMRGHLQRVCNGGKQKVKYITEGADNDESGNDEVSHSLGFLALYQLKAERNNPFIIELQIAGKAYTMEIDTGASVSVITNIHYEKHFSEWPLMKSRVKLHSYTGNALQVVGQIYVPVQFKEFKGELPLTIVRSDKLCPNPMLLGRNWIKVLELHLTMDCINQMELIAGNNKNEDLVNKLRGKFSSVFKEGFGSVKGVKVKINLKDSAQPKFCKARSIPYSLRDSVKNELERLVAAGILYPVKTSEWATPIVVVEKAQKGIRICGDYKVTINPVSTTEHYPLPNINDIFATMKEAGIFTLIDLSNAYLQLELDEESQRMLTINTHLGLFRFRRLPFGINSAPAIFQATMDKILQDIPKTNCYIDVILIATPSQKENIQIVEQVLERLESAGIHKKNEKTQFFQTSVTYLGHTLDREGIRPNKERVDAIMEAPEPTDVSTLRAFLGLVNFYGKCLPNLSSELRPLHELLETQTAWKWTKECERSVQRCKELLTSCKTLGFYNPNKALMLTCDASSYGVGAVLSQTENGEDKPIYYASKTLSRAERNYAQLEKEALSIIFGIKKFHLYLYGREFTLYTDHKPLITILGPKEAVPTLAAARLQRWALILSAYKYQIKYKPGNEIANADALSRLPVECKEELELNYFSPTANLPLSAKDIEKHVQKDRILARVLDYVLRGWPGKLDNPEMQPYFTKREELSLDQGCIMWGRRAIIPKTLQKQVLHLLHEQHPGVVRTKMLAECYVWWTTILTDIEEMARHCDVCQRTMNNKPAEPNRPWPWTTRIFERVHIDFGERNREKFLILVDSYSKWTEVKIMKSTTANATIEVLRPIIAAYGIPETMVADNGPPFRSEELKTFCTQNGIRQIWSPPYHPKSNGAAERTVQTIKQALGKMEVEDKRDSNKRPIQHQIDNILFAYRNTPQTTTGKSPAEIFLNRVPRTRIGQLKPTISKLTPKRQETETKEIINFKINDKVYVKSVRNERVKWYPGVIVEVKSPMTYIVKVTNSTRFVHADHLKKRVVDPPDKENLESMGTPPIIRMPSIAEVETEVDPERNNVQEEDNQTENVSSENPAIPTATASSPLPRRSTRIRKAPEKLDL